MQQSWQAQLLELEHHLNTSTADWKVGCVGWEGGCLWRVRGQHSATRRHIPLCPAKQPHPCCCLCHHRLRSWRWGTTPLTQMGEARGWAATPHARRGRPACQRLVPPVPLRPPPPPAALPPAACSEHQSNADIIQRIEPLFWRYGVQVRGSAASCLRRRVTPSRQLPAPAPLPARSKPCYLLPKTGLLCGP